MTTNPPPPPAAAAAAAAPFVFHPEALIHAVAGEGGGAAAAANHKEARDEGASTAAASEQYELDYVRFRTNWPVLPAMVTLGFIFHSAALTRGDDASVYRLPLVVVCGATIVLSVVSAVCAGPEGRSGVGSLGFALRHERVIVAYFVAYGIAYGIVYPMRNVAFCAEHQPDDAHCRHAKQQFAFNIVPNALLLVPRIRHLVPAAAVATAANIAGVAAVGVLSPVEIVMYILMTAGQVAAVIGIAIGRDKAERAHFHSEALLAVRTASIDEQRATNDAILATVLPAAMLETRVVGTEVAGAHHEAESATVGVTDIYDFAEWSAGHLEQDVVFVLHMLITAFDKGCAESEGAIQRAMTFGDTYVICSGLLAPHDENSREVLHFARWQLRAGQAVAAMVQRMENRPFRLRLGVCSGPLSGGTVGGDHSQRYVVAGPALDGAAANVAECGPNAVVVSGCLPPETVLPSSVVWPCTERLYVSPAVTLSR